MNVNDLKDMGLICESLGHFEMFARFSAYILVLINVTAQSDTGLSRRTTRTEPHIGLHTDK